MTGLGTLVNMAAILIGSGIGLFIKKMAFPNGCRPRFPAQWGSVWSLLVLQALSKADERIRNYL